MIRYWYKWANSNSLGSFGPNFWGWRVSNRNYYRNGMSSWFKWISSEDICLKSVYKLKNVQNEHVSIMVDEVIQTLVYEHGSKMFFVGRIDWSTTRDLDFYTTVVRQRLTHFNSALNLKNASIFSVSIFDFIFPEIFWSRNSDSDEDLLKKSIIVYVLGHSQ